MTRCFIFAFSLSFCLRVAASEIEAIEGGRSPDGKFEVVNAITHKASGLYPDPERHFEVRSKDGATVFSQLSLKEFTEHDDSGVIFAFDGAEKILWRPDSRFVAISTRTSKFSAKTVGLSRDGSAFHLIPLPEYEPFDEAHAEFGTSDNTHREPLRWQKNGDLVLDITMGYHTKSDGHISGYFATVHFSGHPVTAVRSSRTKITNRD